MPDAEIDPIASGLFPLTKSLLLPMRDGSRTAQMNARIHVLSCSHVLTRAFTSIEAALFFQRKHGRRMALLDIGQLDTAALFHYVSGRALRFPRKNNPTVCEDSTCNRKPKHKHFCNAAPVGSCSAWRTSDESVETFFFSFRCVAGPGFRFTGAI